MNLHYIQQNSLNPFEFQICQAYYEDPNNHTTPLVRLQNLCSQYHITLEQLAAITRSKRITRILIASPAILLSESPNLTTAIANICNNLTISAMTANHLSMHRTNANISPICPC